MLAGCPAGNAGTIDLDIAVAPGSSLDVVDRLRLTITRPRQTFELARNSDGFDLSLDLDASGLVGAFVLEGFDAAGEQRLVGQSPPFSFSGIDARVVIYLAPAFSIAPAIEQLAPPRASPAVTSLTYGAVLAGGVVAGGAPSDAIEVYNAFDHAISAGAPLPAPRAGLAIATGSNGAIHLFGGRDASGTPTGTAWLFDTTVAPAGGYIERGDFPQFARSDERAVSLGNDRFLVTGATPLEVNGAAIGERPEAFALTAGAAQLTAAGLVSGLLVEAATGGGRLVQFSGASNTLTATPLMRPGASIASLPDDRFAVVGGELGGVIVVDATTGAQVPDLVAEADPTPRPAIAATGRHLVIARAGQVDVLDARTLARLAAIPHAAAVSAAIALPNDQVLLVGATLELLTPPPPE